MKEIIVPYKVSYRLFMEAYGGQYIGLIVMTLAVGGCGAVLIYSPGGRPVLFPTFIMITVIALLLFVQVMILSLFYYRKYRPFSNTEVVVSSHGIYIENPNGANRISWDSVTYCRKTKNTFVLKTGPAFGVILSKEALYEKKAYFDFLNHLKSKGILSAQSFE